MRKQGKRALMHSNSFRGEAVRLVRINAPQHCNFASCLFDSITAARQLPPGSVTHWEGLGLRMVWCKSGAHVVWRALHRLRKLLRAIRADVTKLENAADVAGEIGPVACEF